ncbi:MAG: hypothetical protein QME74_04210 [Candidatus Edwardsbacteria bacterium]|nr:hypothetical protein [Candidatus Edwardsbacteria bacterium]
MWVAWDSSANYFDRPILVGYYHNDTLFEVTNIIDSAHSYTRFDHFALAANNASCVYVAWSPILMGYYKEYSHIFLKSYKNISWDTIQIAVEGIDYVLSADGKIVKCLAFSSDSVAPIVLSSDEYHGMAEYAWWFSFGYWDVDSGWVERSFSSVGFFGGSGFRTAPLNIAATCDQNGNFLVVYCDTVDSDTFSLICKRFTYGLFTYDTTFVIKSNCYAQDGAAIKGLHPTLAWSDSHSIFLNTYYDTIWSQPPLRISDTALHNCINPDIVAENDSTVWVCYQNDGEIYVTRTSLPLGVAGNPNIEYRIPNIETAESQGLAEPGKQCDPLLVYAS